MPPSALPRFEPAFGVDLVTFFHPGFWGVADAAGITDLAQAQPRDFWNRLLDGVAASGVTGVELTFPPMDWRGAVAAYGSVEAVQDALSVRGLRLTGAFFGDMAARTDAGADIADPAVQAEIVQEAEALAGFLSACGGEVVVAGLPMRRAPGQSGARPFDLPQAQVLADLLNRLGLLLHGGGVRLALHTEGHSVFAMARDIDLLLLLTDPAYVHFCPDSAHIVLMGGDPLQIVERHHERVVIAHWKDATGPMPADTPIDAQIHDRHRPYFCGLGLGCVDWPGWVGLLARRGLTGWAILELDAAPDPVSDIRQGLEMIRRDLIPA